MTMIFYWCVKLINFKPKTDQRLNSDYRQYGHTWNTSPLLNILTAVSRPHKSMFSSQQINGSYFQKHKSILCFHGEHELNRSTNQDLAM
uniref:Uncharacterized protein n=1 Tax=Anguilla anguilla TaxID=7936 RepID=A0A0E9XPL1_ANGAN